MKTGNTAAWGWCCENGMYDYGEFDRRKRRAHIDDLEGNAVVRAMEAMGTSVANHRVPVYIDNSAFQLSLKKGWSHAQRLTDIIQTLYELSSERNCIMVPIWISTHDNVGADALSRFDFDRFHEWARSHIPCPPYRRGSLFV